MASRWKGNLRALILAALVLGPGFRPPVPARAEGERLVLAFYYAWYDQATWSSGKVPDVPSEPYVSANPEVMARQIDQAKGAGLDAFVLNWWGQGNQTEKNLKTLLDEAAQKGFRVAVDFDPNSPFMQSTGGYAQNLQHLHAVHAAHPAYLRYNGRPVIFFYNVSRLPVGTWQSLRDQVDPQRQALWIAEGTELGYQSVFDGHHLYSIAWPNRIPPAQTLSKWGDRVRAYNRDHGTSKLWVATVMPGYDDRNARPGSGFAQGRDGGDYYRRSWQAAIASKPQWVIVNSFNEWPEGTYIEPSKAYGNLYLELTREWAGRFRSADMSAVAPAPALPALTPTPRPTALPPAPTPTPTPAPTPWPYGEEVQAYLWHGCGYVLSDTGWVIFCPISPSNGQGILLAY